MCGFSETAFHAGDALPSAAHRLESGAKPPWIQVQPHDAHALKVLKISPFSRDCLHCLPRALPQHALHTLKFFGIQIASSCFGKHQSVQRDIRVTRKLMLRDATHPALSSEATLRTVNCAFRHLISSRVKLFYKEVTRLVGKMLDQSADSVGIASTRGQSETTHRKRWNALNSRRRLISTAVMPRPPGFKSGKRGSSFMGLL
jgi:hypothetical protein